MSRRFNRSLIPVLLVGVAGGPALAGAQGDTTRALPHVVVLATGGTIAGAAATDVQAAYTSGQVGVEQLLAAVPQAKKLARLTGEQISNIGSQDMNDEVWIKLATRINEITAKPDVAGVVITHGTDTIEETAYFLNLVVKSRKPVVLTAAMRPSTALSADGPLNFYNAVAVAADPQAAGRGVLVVVNDWIHGASSLTKTSTTAVQTFLSPVSGLISSRSACTSADLRSLATRRPTTPALATLARTWLRPASVVSNRAGITTSPLKPGSVTSM